MLSDFQYCIQLMLKNQANIKTHSKNFNDKYHDFHCRCCGVCVCVCVYVCECSVCVYQKGLCVSAYIVFLYCDSICADVL